MNASCLSINYFKSVMFITSFSSVKLNFYTTNGGNTKAYSFNQSISNQDEFYNHGNTLDVRCYLYKRLTGLPLPPPHPTWEDKFHLVIQGTQAKNTLADKPQNPSHRWNSHIVDILHDNTNLHIFQDKTRLGPKNSNNNNNNLQRTLTQKKEKEKSLKEKRE